MKVSVIIPTLNAAKLIDSLLFKLNKQTLSPDEIIIVDSESDDDTILRAATHPITRVISIKRSDFDHGGTRDMAFRASIGDVVLFLTQDAMVRDDTYVESLVHAVSQDGIACAYGRQIAQADAPLYEKYTRDFNYPAQRSLRDAKDIPRLGIKAFFLSDACSAYRRDAYLAVGGFDYPVLTNEDMLIAAKFLHAGYQISYCSDAVILHSHHYSWKQEYERNYKIGNVLRLYRERLCCATAGSEGLRFAMHVIYNLLKHGAVGSCMEFCYLCTAKLFGNWKGRNDAPS